MTAQRSDKLIYKGNEYELASEPLYICLYDVIAVFM